MVRWMVAVIILVSATACGRGPTELEKDELSEVVISGVRFVASSKMVVTKPTVVRFIFSISNTSNESKRLTVLGGGCMIRARSFTHPDRNGTPVYEPSAPCALPSEFIDLKPGEITTREADYTTSELIGSHPDGRYYFKSRIVEKDFGVIELNAGEAQLFR